MEPYTFVDVPAKVFSFSHDYVMQTIDPPVTVTFVDFEGGGRLMCDMTDRDPAAIEVGIPLEMTFRRLYYVGGIYNYWWKCQPVRGSAERDLPPPARRSVAVDSIKDKVAIVGMGCVKFGENWDKSLEDMIVDAAYEAFEDAGIEPKDIEAAWWGNVFAGESASIMSAPAQAGLHPGDACGEPVRHRVGSHTGSRVRRRRRACTTSCWRSGPRS